MHKEIRAGKSEKWWWTGPPAVYLCSLASLALNQAADKVIGNFLSYVVLQILIFALPLLLILFFVKNVEKVPFWSSTGFTKISWLRIVSFTAILNFVSFLLSTSLFSAGEYLAPRMPEGARYDPGAVQTAFQGLPRAAYWYMIFTSVVYAGFGEELTFRGYILTRLSRKGKLFAVATSALMWSSLHLWYLPTLGSTGIWQHLDVLLVGILFGAAYLRIQSILPLIAAHAFSNILLPLSFLYPGAMVDTLAFAFLTVGFLVCVGLSVSRIYSRFVRGPLGI